MSQLFIRKIIHVKKDHLSVFNLIHDFHHWTKWSPWLIADPKAEVNIEADGKYYHWKSPILGSGEMRILNQEEGQSVSCALQFFKPWKSKAKVTFYLNPKNQGTEVVWTLHCRLPFYMFWMKKQMETLVGMDYERGLLLLKDLAENGTISCKLNFDGILPFDYTHYFGLRKKTTFTEFKNEMTNDFKTIMPYMEEHYKELLNGAPFSMYHQFDAIKNKVEYTVGFPIKYPITSSHIDYFISSLPKMKAYSIELTGSYKFLPNAWAALMMHQRASHLKPLKKVPPLEIYLNKPEDTPENELRTKVLFPIR